MDRSYRPGQCPGISLARRRGGRQHHIDVDSFRDAVVIVTGGSRGPGRDIARALAGRGFVIVLVYLDDQAEADAAIDEILVANGTALSVRADLTDRLDVERLFAETAAAFGGVDVVVQTDRPGSRLVTEQAACRVRRGGAIIDVTDGPGVSTPDIVDTLLARGITMTGIELAPDPAADHLDITHLLEILETGRASPAD